LGQLPQGIGRRMSSTARQRVRNVALLAALAVFDLSNVLLAHGPHHSTVIFVTTGGVIATVALLVSLTVGKGDWLLRGVMLAVTVAWTAFKGYMLVDLLRNFD